MNTSPIPRCLTFIYFNINVILIQLLHYLMRKFSDFGRSRVHGWTKYHGYAHHVDQQAP